MTKSQNIVGLAIISISDGRELGLVRDLIINPDQGAVEYLMVENETWYLGAQVIPFERLQGVGEYAVTIESEEALQRLIDLPDVLGLIQRQVKVKGTKVLTKGGRLIGLVSEYFVDVASGKIAGCLLLPSRETLGARIIPAESVVTFGRDVLIVAEDLDEASLEEYDGSIAANAVATVRSVAVIDAPKPPLAAPASVPASAAQVPASAAQVPASAAQVPASAAQVPASAAPVPSAATMTSSSAARPTEVPPTIHPIKEPSVEKASVLPVLEDLSVNSLPVEDIDPGSPRSQQEDKPNEAEPFIFPSLEKSEDAEAKPEGGDGQERGPLFGQMQHKYYVGKVLTKTLTNNLGETVAEKGDVITEELIEKVRQSGKYLEMIMNVRE
ncbi:prc-barrel, putative [Heliomicrobium modesticaldum Ice1]|uniref:Prc-barrel, putative n=1 Tax=Heliobacterium modesticaldum (strain ATCC 51547 / Ice1) TaxID=498761 RepID=B0TD34_HELMI|nr:PRC-barrel domain-containing protein [Heliomicrobium modesticaldum]ABZ82732.1 prc-barrel, putative [Heliomicrobium modesticaldum Ice1]